MSRPVLAAAAAFAVAIALLVSVASTPTAEAADVPLAENLNSATAAPGDTVQIAVNGALAQVSITGTGDGVGASFAANDGQSINCSDNLACDENNAVGAIQVDLNVDDDSGEGYILVSVVGVGGDPTTTQVTKVITVSKESLLGSLNAETSSKTIAANDDNAAANDNGPNEADILATVKNASADADGLNGQRVTFITTLGTLACPTSSDAAGANTIAAVSGVQVCSVWTTNQDNPLTAATDADDGFATVRLDGAGREGVATVTVTVGGFTEQLDVTMYGTAKNLSTSPMQDSIEIGGSVFVVLTVTDAAGNPVSGQTVAPVQSPAKEVVGPADDAVLVVTSKEAPNDNDAANGFGYNVDYIADNAANSLPACGDDKDPVTDNTATPPTTENFTANGTNADGKCVVEVSAPEKADGDPKDATRGAHTLNFAIGTIKASATIEVAGKPSSITTDAPAMVEPASVTAITVSVWDDEDVLVGITSVKVRKVGGDGLIEDQGEAGSEMTSNGQSEFTFIAPSTSGTAEILITAGDVDERVTIAIGLGAEPEPAPEPPTAPENVRISSSDGALSVVTTPAAGEGQTTEAEVSSNGTWVAVPETAEPGTYFARARFVEGDLASEWTYSSNSATIDPPPPPPPPEPEISVSGQSGSIGVLNAGSLEDLLGALDCGGNAGTTVTIDGNTYVVGAPDVVNSAFLANVAFPIDFGGAYVNCR